MIRHYSFDLWSTLIKSNKEFKTARAMHIYKNYTDKEYTGGVSDVYEVIRSVDLECNARCEMSGRHIDALDMYAMVLFRLHGTLKNITVANLQQLYKEMEELTYKFPPTIYDEDTIEVLNELHERGYTMNILSNTGFINGKSLLPLLHNLGISKHMMFMHFSDETGVCKPDAKAFAGVHHQLPYSKRSIVHVGDNKDADGIGALHYGFIPRLVHGTTSSTLKDLL